VERVNTIAGSQVINQVVQVSTSVYATIGSFTGTVNFGGYTETAVGTDGFFAYYVISGGNSVLTELYIVSCMDNTRGDVGKTIAHTGGGAAGIHMFFELADVTTSCTVKNSIDVATMTINRNNFGSGAGLYLKLINWNTFNLIEGQANSFVVL
jgi:hypothetical protein